MSIFLRRNAVVGWAVIKAAKRVLKSKLPGRRRKRRLPRAAAAAGGLTAAGAVVAWLLSRRKRGGPDTTGE